MESNLNNSHSRSGRRHHRLNRIARIRAVDHIRPILLRPLLCIHHGHHLHRLDGGKALHPHRPGAGLGHDEIRNQDPGPVFQGRHQVPEDSDGVFVRPVVQDGPEEIDICVWERVGLQDILSLEADAGPKVLGHGSLE